MEILDWLCPRRPVTLRVRGVGEPTLYFETSDPECDDGSALGFATMALGFVPHADSSDEESAERSDRSVRSIDDCCTRRAR